MADRKSVRAELERKKIQLAQMRQERERRSRMLQDENSSPLNLENPDRLEDADSVLHALGLSASLSRASTAPSNVSSMDQSRLLAQSADSEFTSSHQNSLSQQPQQFSNSLNESFVSEQPHSASKTSVSLQMVHVNQINIAPKERVYYTKSTQTQTAATAAAVAQQNASDPGVPQGDGAIQQKSYYGKQKLNAIPPALQPNALGRQTPESPTTNNSLNHPNTQPTGVNQLALEWDDEFPGMSRLDLDYSACKF